MLMSRSFDAGLGLPSLRASGRGVARSSSGPAMRGFASRRMSYQGPLVGNGNAHGDACMLHSSFALRVEARCQAGLGVARLGTAMLGLDRLRDAAFGAAARCSPLQGPFGEKKMSLYARLCVALQRGVRLRIAARGAPRGPRAGKVNGK